VPDYAEAYCNRAAAYIGREQYNEAIADYTAALAVRKDDPEALVNRGAAYIGKGDYEKARKDFDAALKISPGYHEALYNLGIAHYNKGSMIKPVSISTKRGASRVCASRAGHS